MAERRMFAKTIIDSDAFLDMPLSTQSLYFHMSMRADDDGFVNNPKKIQRMVGASDDDMKLLIAKSFIIPFESGIVVIKHWRIHNYIQSDRYKPTVYVAEKSLLSTNNNTYALDTGCIQDVSSLDTQVRLGKSKSKDRLSKDRKEQVTIVTADAEGFDEFWEAYPRKTSKAEARKAWNKLKPNEELREKMLASIEAWKNTDQWREPRYIPHPSTWLNQERWNDEVPEDPYERLRRQIEEMERSGHA